MTILIEIISNLLLRWLIKDDKDKPDRERTAIWPRPPRVDPRAMRRGDEGTQHVSIKVKSASNFATSTTPCPPMLGQAKINNRWKYFLKTRPPIYSPGTWVCLKAAFQNKTTTCTGYIWTASKVISRYALCISIRVQWHLNATRSSQTARTFTSKPQILSLNIFPMERYFHPCLYIIVTIFQCELDDHIIASWVKF